MIKTIRKILSKVLIAILAIVLVTPGMAVTTSNIHPDIGDFGAWATDANRELFIGKISNDIEQFQGNLSATTSNNFVPIEAKVGLAFINALSFISGVLEISFVRFVSAFIIIMFLFWVSFEAYNIMVGKAKTEEAIKGIVKNAGIVMIWVVVLGIGPAETFMMVMSPIMMVSSAISDLILGAVTQVAGVQLPDTCAAIHAYTAQHMSETSIITPDAAADIMCVPTRMSGFCYSAIAIGWKWIGLGIGVSAFSFLCGGALIGMFLYLAWKFAFIGFGVIADLFLGIIMLPFTAIAESIKKTSYDGIPGRLYNEFTSLFSTESLQRQVSRFMDAALHFVVLSIVIAICATLLSGIINTNTANTMPEFTNPNIWGTILICALTCYLANHATQIATERGGPIDYSFGTQLKSDITTLWNDAKKQTKEWWKIIKEARKKK